VGQLLLSQFPYALPSLVTACLRFAGASVAWACLQEPDVFTKTRNVLVGAQLNSHKMQDRDCDVTVRLLTLQLRILSPHLACKRSVRCLWITVIIWLTRCLSGFQVIF